jgi:4-azaleucine resistance transporter AzlC
MPSRRHHFLAGCKDITPILLGVVPFAMITGVAAVNVGIPKLPALAMSVIIFAGASQLATIELLGQNAPVVVILLTALVINLRFVMYSASIAPYFKKLSGRWRRSLAYLLTDQAYVVAVNRFRHDAHTHTSWYFLGVAGTMWVSWQMGTAAGVLLGAEIPASWSLDFAIPLTFLAILVPTIKDRATLATALAAGLVAVGGVYVPFNLGLLLAALAGIVVGLSLEKRPSHDTP